MDRSVRELSPVVEDQIYQDSGVAVARIQTQQGVGLRHSGCGDLAHRILYSHSW